MSVEAEISPTDSVGTECYMLYVHEQQEAMSLAWA